MGRLIRRLTAPAIVEVAGAVAIVYGCSQWSAPLAWVVGGLGCFGLSFTLEARRRRRPADPDQVEDLDA